MRALHAIRIASKLRLMALILILAGVLGIIQAENYHKLALHHGTLEKAIRWNGKAGETYFVQRSTDLKNWSFFPVIYSGTGSQISHGFNNSLGQFFTRLKWTNLPDGGDPYAQDFDQDGLSSIAELTSAHQTDPLNRDTDGDELLDGWEVLHGYLPNKSDSDGDGLPDGIEDPDGDGAINTVEQANSGDPHDAIDEGLAPLEVHGWESEGVEVVESRSYCIPAGSSDYLVVAHIHSEEFPEFTSILSPYDDQLRWLIEASNAETIADSVSVNTLHDEWMDSEADGSSYRSYTPIASKVLGRIRASFEEDVTVDLEVGVTNVGDGDLSSTAIVRLVPFMITPDWNRDGRIDHKDRARISQASPWPWWINDDDDKPLTAGATDGSGDIPTGRWGDSRDNKVDGVRDLIDFFPLHVDLRKLLVSFPKERFHYELKQADGALKIFEVPDADILADGGAAVHIMNVGKANAMSRSNTWRTKKGRRLSDKLLDAMAMGKGMVLCEGSNISNKPLLLEIKNHKGERVASIGMPMRISRVENMYRHANVRDLIPGSDIGSLSTRMEDPGDPYPDALTNGKYFVFVHGYNIDSYNARGWHAEIFKRMHQMGSRARFVGVTWSGDTGLNYHQAVKHAFLTGDQLKERLPSGPNVTIAGHSLGNMVVSHAIEYGGYQPNRYYMLNAATPIEAYDPSQTRGEDGREMATFMTESSWRKYLLHRRKLFASDWWQLFGESDGRYQLKWEGRFAEKVPKIATNFYSTGEDVVANPRARESVGNHLKEVITHFNASEYAWVAQEISKGSDFMELVALNGTHAGWKLNKDSEFWKEIKTNENWEERIEELVDEVEVQRNPFYDPFNDAELYHAVQGSEKAKEKLIQYQLLATAIPAKSFAVAANAVSAFGRQNSYNMMTLKSEDAWPRNGKNWLHSDFRNVAMPYVDLLYERMIQIGDLNEQ